MVDLSIAFCKRLPEGSALVDLKMRWLHGYKLRYKKNIAHEQLHKLRYNAQSTWTIHNPYGIADVRSPTISGMLHGAGIFTTIYPIFMAQFCR